MPAHADNSSWPAQLRPGAVRFGRASRHYDKTIAFYRDLIGLPIVGEFTASFGEDGTILGLPDSSVQLEIIRGHQPVAPASFDQLVLYFDNAARVDAATSPAGQRCHRVSASGLTGRADAWRAQNSFASRAVSSRATRRAPSTSAVAMFGRKNTSRTSCTPAHVSQSRKKGAWKSEPNDGPRPGP
jgi:YycE-like N-terminal domain